MGGAASVKVQKAKNVKDKAIENLLHDKKALKQFWKKLDFNGNGLVSLAEIDKMIVTVPGFQKFNNKPAMMRAYKKTCYADGDGDAFVEKKEFSALLMNIYYFDKLWKVFDDIDTGDDRRVDMAEFKAGCAVLGIDLSDEEAAVEFGKMDRNGGGHVLFDEFCKYAAAIAMGTPPASIDDGSKPKTQRQALKTSRVQMGAQLDAVGAAAAANRPKAARKKNPKLRNNAEPEVSVDPALLPAFLNAAKGGDAEINALLANKEKLNSMWKELDFNGNNKSTLAEIDKFILTVPGFSKFNNKPALIRAYQRTCYRDGGDGDEWIEKKEFPALLRNIYYFNKLWKVFEDVDTGDDRRVDIHEFMAGMDKMGVKLTETQGLNAFLAMDRNGGGQVLFDEFCIFFAKMSSGKLPDLDRELPRPGVPKIGGGRALAAEEQPRRPMTVGQQIGSRLHSSKAGQYRDPNRFKKARKKGEMALSPYEGPKIVTHGVAAKA